MAVESEKLCEEALKQNEDRLAGLPNVVGLGIVSRKEDEPADDDLAVGVYVSRKVPPATLKRADRIPKRLRVKARGRYRMVPVRVIEQGEVVLEADASAEVPTEPTLGKEPL